MEDLKSQLNPEGSIEEILVEKLAVSYWRLRRAYKYEAGLIRENLDNAEEDFYNKTDLFGHHLNKKAIEIEEEIESEKESIDNWKNDEKELKSMLKKGSALEEIYNWEENWNWLQDDAEDLIDLPEAELDYLDPGKLREYLQSELNWSDEKIWNTHIKICGERIEYHKEHLQKLKVDLKKEKAKNRLKLQVFRKLGNVPSKVNLEKLLRYESSIWRQFYKALNQLERLQRIRSGEAVPPQIDVNIDLNDNKAE